MEKNELHARLKQKVSACWSAYVDSLLEMTPSVLISRADEIAAASFCHDQLVSGEYPEHLLEHLLRYDNPLETMRERWMEEQDVDLSDEFEHALWSLWNYGPEPENGPAVDDGMAMK